MRYLRLKGRQGIAFLRFDVTPARGTKVAGGRLYLCSTGRAFTTDRISTIAEDWVEGKARNAVEIGASCFLYRVCDSERWRGGECMSVIMGKGGRW